MTAEAPRPTPQPIRILRAAQLTLHLTRALLAALVFYPCIGPQRSRQFKQRWSRRLLHILSVRIEAPAADARSGSMIVANHISWLDIFAINALCPAAFIAKTDVRKWPLIGWLAARNDTVFLQHGSRGHAKAINAEIDAMLAAGSDVALFPEGTTTDGTHLLGFHAALLQPAVETGHPVLPVAISYHDATGNLNQAPAYTGETTLAECVAAILSCRSLTVRIQAAPAIDTRGMSRRDVSLAAHAAIAALLATTTGFRPPSTAPGTAPGLPA